jgi:starch phosphorylase
MQPFAFPYPVDPAYERKTAYLCMEFGIHQALKTYAGGLGFLSGSVVRSAYDRRMPLIGIGIRWTHGYYDQRRKSDQTMETHFSEKQYAFLQETRIRFSIEVSGQPVRVAVHYLAPEIFHTAPVFFLTTDIPENDHLSRCLSHRLYDSNPEAAIAASMLLGHGGHRLLQEIGWEPDVYHMNESHALPVAFALYRRLNDPVEARRRLVFTNHTPEAAGNPRNSCSLLQRMGYFGDLPMDTVRHLTCQEGASFDHTLAALRLARIANGVSRMHVETLQRMWKDIPDICPVIPVTNAQKASYWQDEDCLRAVLDNDAARVRTVKALRKKTLFDVVADQCGRLFDPSVCTLVFAKRFAGYKRADLLLHRMDRFEALLAQRRWPIQVIWAGKPYPQDYNAIGVFDRIVGFCRRIPNCAILTGYELDLSRTLKKGADVWLNVPRLHHEASGTSGMAAAMCGAVNLALPDGWYPEFARHRINGFVIPPCDPDLPEDRQDLLDADSLLDTLEKEVLPMYYQDPDAWTGIAMQAARDILPAFDSDRLVDDYHHNLYRENPSTPTTPPEHRPATA